MRIGDAYPSNFFSARDITTDRTLQIEGFAVEPIRDRDSGAMIDKPVVRFVDEPKALILNRTNGNMLSSLYGEETNGWSGHWITLYVTETEGAYGRGIRIRDRKPAPERAATSKTKKVDNVSTDSPY